MRSRDSDADLAIAMALDSAEGFRVSMFVTVWRLSIRFGRRVWLQEVMT